MVFDTINIVIAIIFTLQVALGLTVIFGVLRVINMAHGDLFMVGAYVVVVAHRLGMSPWLGVLAAPVVVGVLGALIERVVIRSLYGRRDLSTLLATFGVSIVLEQVARLLFGPQTISPPLPIEGTIQIFGTTYPAYRLVAACIGLLSTLAVAVLLFRSSWGVRVRATVESNSIAAAMGVRTNVVSSSAFAMGSALAGLAGALMAPFAGANYMMGLSQTVTAFLVVITGGLGSVLGAAGGSVLIGGGGTLVENWISGSASELVVLAVAVVVIFLRPRGLFAKRERVA